MDLQYIGQTVFKSLNKKKHAIFFSLLRKVFIVVPLTIFFLMLSAWEQTVSLPQNRCQTSSVEASAL